MTVTNRSVAERYTWAEVCEGWRLLDADDLSVIEEVMPPGTQEVRHTHRKANQVFYVLDGALTLEVEGQCHRLAPGDALNVRSGQAHQARNEGQDDVRFLVISAPTTRGDRDPA